MTIKSYRYIKVRDDAKLPQLKTIMQEIARGNLKHDTQTSTTHLDAFSRVAPHDRVFHIERDVKGDAGTVVVRSVDGKLSVDVPWTSVRHAVEEPAKESAKGKPKQAAGAP